MCYLAYAHIKEPTAKEKIVKSRGIVPLAMVKIVRISYTHPPPISPYKEKEIL